MSVLSCSACLARYSEYLDGVMDAEATVQWRTHLANCPNCARYDRVLRRGLAYLAAQPQPQLTPEFTTDLHQRLALEERRLAMRPMTSLASATIAVAAMLAFAAWLPVLVLSRSGEPPAAVASLAAASTVSSEIAWHAEEAVSHQVPARVHQARRVIWLSRPVAPVIEPKYTPVVLESPIAPLNYARTVSYGAD